MSILRRGAHARRPPRPIEAIEEAQRVEEELLGVDELHGEVLQATGPTPPPEALPAGVLDALSGSSTARRGSWHSPCPLCGLKLQATEKVRKVLLTDGQRGWVHAACLAGRLLAPDACRHGISPGTACTWCQGRRPRAIPLSRPFTARRQGRCVLCAVPVQTGSRTLRVSTLAGAGYAHAWHFTKEGGA